MSNNYYVYVFVDPRKSGEFKYEDLTFDYEPYYVGKGKDSRYKRHLNSSQLDAGDNPHKERKLKKIIAAGFNPTQYVTFVISDCDEQTALDVEETAVRKIGRSNLGLGPLCNLVDGGGKSVEHIASVMRGKTYDEIYGEEKAKKLKKIRRESIVGSKNPMFGSTSNRGRKMSEEAKRKLSDAKSKTYEFRHIVSGENITVTNLKKFCTDNNLSLSAMANMTIGLAKTSQGYCLAASSSEHIKRKPLSKPKSLEVNARAVLISPNGAEISLIEAVATHGSVRKFGQAVGIDHNRLYRILSNRLSEYKDWKLKERNNG